MKKAVIVDGFRTAVARGNHTGALCTVPIYDFAAEVLNTLVEKTQLDVKMVDDVILGNVYAYDLCFARYAVLKAGFPVETPAVSVDRNCGSGLQAINFAAMNIMVGNGDVYIAGGAESMSRGYWLIERTPVAFQRGNPNMKTPVGGGIAAPPEYNAGSMVDTAEKVAEEYGISRLEQEQYALESHRKAIAAIDNGYFKDEIIPITVPRKKQEPIIFDIDECPRRDASLETMARLKPLTKSGGTVTVGTSCPVNDAAAAVLIMSEEKALSLGYKPKLYVKSMATSAVHPSVMGIAPITAGLKAIEKAGLHPSDIDAVEFNEAFASQTIATIRNWGIDPEVINIDGGGIAIGHPIAQTGARLTIHLMHVMERLDREKGMVSMCIGGGQALATIFERK
jgi:acetyl-CoA C-acetyltransferase